MNGSVAGAYRDVLRAPHVAPLLLAASLARLAGRALSLAIVLYALADFRSPALAGWLSFAILAPGLVVSPLAGALLGRIGATRGIGLDLVLSALLLFGLVIADWLTAGNATVVLGIVAVFSLTTPLSFAGIRAVLPRLVPAGALDRANALDTTINAMVDVAGPALAGVLVAVIGASWTFLAIAALYAMAALLVARLPSLRPAGRDPQSLLDRTLEGVLLVLRQPTLRYLALSYALHMMTVGMLIVAVPTVVAEFHPDRLGDLITGLLWACAGVAGGVGALAAGHYRTAERERLIMAAGMIVTGLAVWPVAASFGVTGLAIGLLFVGGAGGPIDVALLTLRQRRTQPDRLAQVLSVSMSLNLLGLPIGSALAGAMITTSPAATFAVAALTSLAGAGAAGLIPRREAFP